MRSQPLACCPPHIRCWINVGSEYTQIPASCWAGQFGMDSGLPPGKPVLLLPKPRLWLPSQLPLLAPSAAALFVLFDIRLLPSKSDLKPLVLTKAPTLGKLPLLEIFLGNCCSSRNQSELDWKCHCSAHILLESDILCSPSQPPLLLHAHLRCCLEMAA